MLLGITNSYVACGKCKENEFSRSRNTVEMIINKGQPSFEERSGQNLVKMYAQNFASMGIIRTSLEGEEHNITVGRKPDDLM